MRALLLASAFAGLCRAVYASEDFVDLEPVPRHLWDANILIEKRDDATHEANVTLSDHEQMLWSTGKDTNRSTIVSMVTWTPQSQRITDMGKFAWGLKAARCTEDMMLQFRHKISFKAAQREWEWVNFNSMRSFVMVADHIKCGRDWSPAPWVVSRATYHEHNLTVLLHAEKSTWKKVTSSYMLDFGEIRRDPGSGVLPKRQLDFNFDGAFTLNLASSWPTTFIRETWGATKFTVSCADCGVQGALEFAGHVEGSVFGGLDHLMISATPRGLGAALNLEATMEGFYNFAGKDWASQEFELFTIPLPSGWRIPGVLTFGPNAKLLAGYELVSIAGKATMTAGISASIPDDAVAKLDIIAKDPVEVSGWTPEFDFHPPELTEGSITAKGRVWGKLAVAVSLEVFDEDGITADVYVKIPLTIEAEVGYDALGFCDDSTNPFGAALELDVGAEIGLEAWKEIDGDKDVLFEHVLFSDYEVLELPDICLSFGDAPEGACMPDMDDETAQWWDNEVDADREEDEDEEDDDDDDDAMKRAVLAPRASRRQSGTRWEYYYMECDPRNQTANRHSKWPIRLKPYPKPTAIEDRGEAGLSVPIMKIGIDGCTNSADISACVPDNWVVNQTEDENELNGVTSWNSEHVYEGNWIRNFFDHLQKNYFRGEAGCENLATSFKISKRGGHAEGMLYSIGTSRTYNEMMTLFPTRENGYKFRAFSPDVAIDRGFGTDSDRSKHYSVHDGVCALGRLVATCRYMEHTETQERLTTSINAMKAVLANADQDSNVPNPGTTTYVDAHKTWFTGMWDTGITKFHEIFVEAAGYLTDPARATDYAALPQEIRTVVDSLAAANGLEAAKELCPGVFAYP